MIMEFGKRCQELWRDVRRRLWRRGALPPVAPVTPGPPRYDSASDPMRPRSLISDEWFAEHENGRILRWRRDVIMPSHEMAALSLASVEHAYWMGSVGRGRPNDPMWLDWQNGGRERFRQSMVDQDTGSRSSFRLYYGLHGHLFQYKGDPNYIWAADMECTCGLLFMDYEHYPTSKECPHCTEERMTANFMGDTLVGRGINYLTPGTASLLREAYALGFRGPTAIAKMQESRASTTGNQKGT